jgi:hypothetical protein
MQAHPGVNVQGHGGAATMKQILLFFAMDIHTILAYPIVFVYGKLYRFSATKEQGS